MSRIAKSTTLVALAIAICLAGMINTSCNNPTPPPNDSTVCVPNLKDTSSLAKIDHFISSDEITTFRKAFNADSLNAKHPDLFITESEGFNKTQLLELLKDPRCVGIRIYYGITRGKTEKKRIENDNPWNR